MKLRAIDKVFLFAGGFLAAVIGVCLFLIGLRAEPLMVADFGGSIVKVGPGWFWGGGILLLAFGVYLIGLPHSYRRKKNDFIVQQTADGEMRISVSAIDGLVRKVMEPRSEMILKSMDIENHKDNVLIDLKVAVAKNISIPLAVAALQRDVKQYLLSSTGADVREVKVSVDTSDEVVTESPYMMHETPARQPHVSEAEAEAAKAPDIKPDEPLAAEEFDMGNAAVAPQESTETETELSIEKERENHEGI